MHLKGYIQFLFFSQEDAGLDDELYKDLQHAVKEANNLTREAYEEALRRQKAERDLHDAAQKVRPYCMFVYLIWFLGLTISYYCISH